MLQRGSFLLEALLDAAESCPLSSLGRSLLLHEPFVRFLGVLRRCFCQVEFSFQFSDSVSLCFDDFRDVLVLVRFSVSGPDFGLQSSNRIEQLDNLLVFIVQLRIDGRELSVCLQLRV